LHIVNITNQEATAILPEAVIARHGAVDGLINNAGIIQPFVRFNDLKDSDIERIINVNLWGGDPYDKSISSLPVKAS
jgi:NAD(P)-dependent dehydrogenase (short-subunit alcohol dehydrogenase family)